MTAAVLYVVPTYNRAAELPRTLLAIAAQRWPDACKSILVVDNSSTDETPAVLADIASRLPFPLEHLRKAPEGPTVARNIGLRRAGDRYVALVDSDVELDPGWTEATVAALEADPGLAQVGGKLVFGHDPTLLNSYGGGMGWLALAWDRGEGAPAADYTEPSDTLWINTSAVLVRPGPALDVGGFDEGFFYSYEEPDLGSRLRLAGWRSRVIPTAIAFHHVNMQIVASHPDLVFHYSKNRVRMGMKVLNTPHLLVFLLLSVGYGLADAIVHPPRRSRFRALWWNATHVAETWRMRQVNQARRKVPDRELLALLDRRWFPPQRLYGLRRRIVPGSLVVRGADDRFTAKPTA